MQFILNCIDAEAHHRYAVSLDENCFFCAHGELEIDVLMGILANISYHTTSKVRSAIESINQAGHQSLMDCVAPGGVRMIVVHPQQDLDHLQAVSFDFRSDTVRMIDGTEYDLRDFWAPQERLEQGKKDIHGRKSTDHPFLFRYPEQSGGCNINDLQAGSITFGILNATTPGPYNSYRQDLSKLAGLLIGEAGIAFQTDISGPRKGGSQSMSTIRSNLIHNGLLSGDRAYCPEIQIKGTNWNNVAKVADPAFADLGGALGPVLIRIDQESCHEMMLSLLESFAEDPVQYSLDRWTRSKMSSHQSLKLQGYLIEIRQILEAHQKEVVDAHI